jgi:hypothetical protein
MLEQQELQQQVPTLLEQQELQQQEPMLQELQVQVLELLLSCCKRSERLRTGMRSTGFSS